MTLGKEVSLQLYSLFLKHNQSKLTFWKYVDKLLFDMTPV